MKIRLAADLQSDSIVDGLGIRTVIWTQGCSHNCPSCHNPETHDFSGGDPMFQPKQCAILAKKVHELNMNVWAYTGFTYEELLEKGSKDILEFLGEIDVLIDGKFDPSKKSLDLEFRGSSNQRIIDVKKSLENHKVILFDLKNKKIEPKKEKLYI